MIRPKYNRIITRVTNGCYGENRKMNFESGMRILFRRQYKRNRGFDRTENYTMNFVYNMIVCKTTNADNRQGSQKRIEGGGFDYTRWVG